MNSLSKIASFSEFLVASCACVVGDPLQSASTLARARKTLAWRLTCDPVMMLGEIFGLMNRLRVFELRGCIGEEISVEITRPSDGFSSLDHHKGKRCVDVA